MIWPFSKFASWAEEMAVRDAQSTEDKIKAANEKVALKAARAASKDFSMMKKIVVFCLINGVAWVWCSYILAFLGHDTIAESLSQVALAEIIGVVLTYAIKSVVENLSKHNHWPDRFHKEVEETIEQKEYSFEGGVGSNNEEDYIGG